MSGQATFVATIPPSEPVFPQPDKAAAMLRRDLRAAEIAYRDEAGMIFDFHALRCECATLADAAGVSPRVVQRLMRHSTLDLTGRYTRPRLHDIEGATSALPSLRPERPDTEPARATGTYAGQAAPNLAHHLPTGGDRSGRSPSDAGGMVSANPHSAPRRIYLRMSELSVSGRGLSAIVVNAPGRIRTCDLRFRKPPRRRRKC